MKSEDAATIINAAFRGIRCRLERDGLLDLIVGRMTGVLCAAVADEREACARLCHGHPIGALIRERE